MARKHRLRTSTRNGGLRVIVAPEQGPLPVLRRVRTYAVCLTRAPHCLRLSGRPLLALAGHVLCEKEGVPRGTSSANVPAEKSVFLTT